MLEHLKSVDFRYPFKHTHSKEMLILAMTFYSYLYIIIRQNFKTLCWNIQSLHGFDASVVKKGRNSLGEHLLTWQHEASRMAPLDEQKNSWFHSSCPCQTTLTAWLVTCSCCQTIQLAEIQIPWIPHIPWRQFNWLKFKYIILNVWEYASEVARV